MMDEVARRNDFAVIGVEFRVGAQRPGAGSKGSSEREREREKERKRDGPIDTMAIHLRHMCIIN
ncbi:hypothetical protein X777_08989 [Ooceraea biroi]|uniref:Uncharacterized protein n=1 Tax=Ooceraea biroi TaxID=2015173 RepID=A0A026WBA3_OOCBI|nr:hypothetical protein X777_08989 [Ooceraea biroi]